MAEYIERSKIVYPYMHEELWWGFNKCTSRVFNEGVKATEDAIAAIPAADVVEVVHGRWENYPSHAFRRCSVCKVEWEKPRFNIRANYCPNCGARMDGDG